MALPTLTRTWITTLNNRITFVSVLDTMQRYLFGIKEFLKANGFTVKGSASAGTGAMDGVDRWASSASVTPRATVAAASQAWVVLTSTATGIDLLLTFQGASDDIARISFSPGGLLVAAGTPNQQPTATDEAVSHLFPTSIVQNTASIDRLWYGWVSADGKACRFVLARNGAWIPSSGNFGMSWGLEAFDQNVMSPYTCLPAANPTILWAVASSNSIPNSTRIGIARANVGGNIQNIAVNWGVESVPLSGTASQYSTSFSNEKPELQGSLGYPIFPLVAVGNTTGALGRMGLFVDFWQGRSAGDTMGDTYGTLQFINAPGVTGTAGGGGVFPWDGATTPILM